MRLLLVEDELAIAQPLKTALEKRQFAVDIAIDGKEGFDKARFTNYDCIILDLNLPEMDGLDVAKQLRQKNIRTPILMLTARTSQDNIYEGFESGTDDYLPKPFDFKELLYRVQALIQRNVAAPETTLTYRDITVDTRGLHVRYKNQEVKLTAKEYGIIEYLMRHKGRVISQEELLEHVWNENIDELSQTVRTTIKTLRKKVDPDKTLIQTFKGKGYVIN
ncbi:MAG: response regulator transcription factor [Candidatus Dojkabacteria bacterium]|nr:MAG: response regulator transcription factor [Candidatus Dojkabacteria bacterium]